MHTAFILCFEEPCFVVQFFMGLLALADKLATTTKQPNKALRNIPCQGKHLDSMVSCMSNCLFHANKGTNNQHRKILTKSLHFPRAYDFREEYSLQFRFR